MDPNSLAIEFICPLCLVLPSDPVLAEDGFIYCKGCIERIVDGGHSKVNSPMTREPMGTTLIYSDTVEETIRDLTSCEDLDHGIRGAWTTGNQGKSTTNLILDTKKKAKQGDTFCMVILAEWLLFGEQDGVERDATKGYYWCKRAANNDMTAKAYQGYCLIRGLGVESDWEDGYELLIEVASQESNTPARDFAAYVLGHCYERAVYGFKYNAKRANKWLAKVQTKPNHNVFAFEFADDVEESQINDQTQLGDEKPTRSTLLFPDGPSVAEESSTKQHLRENDLEIDIVEVDHWSLPSLSTATTSSASTRYSAQSSIEDVNLVRRKCNSCSRDIFDSPFKLCRGCRTVGPKR